jgi:alpha-methylacyl-CoA racemase
VRLCEAIGLVPPPQRDAPSHWPALRASFEQIFKTRTRDEWATLLESGDHCLSPVLGISEAPRHHHLAARGSFIDVGGVIQAGPVPRFSKHGTQPSAGVRDPVPIAHAMASKVAG